MTTAVYLDGSLLTPSSRVICAARVHDFFSFFIFFFMAFEKSRSR